MYETLIQKVKGQITPLGNANDPLLDAAHTHRGSAELSEFEADLREWGLIFGLAYGIARTDCAFEGSDSVAARALEAAKAVFADWSGEMSCAPDRDEQMRTIRAAYDRFAELEGFPRREDPRYQVLIDLNSAVLQASDALGVGGTD